ncbi:MAG: hypothetical protein WED11_05100 [Natronospirillum sp.]
MSRILFCWELGLNSGHVRHITWLQARFRERGHTVAFCLKDTAQGRQFLGPDAHIVPAPLPALTHSTDAPIRNYAELLKRHGFDHPIALCKVVRDWLRVYQQFRPDLIVGDHAPTAVLAARCAGIPAAVYGIGFLIPPLQAPMPCFEWWRPSPPRVELRQVERGVLAAINYTLGKHQQPPLERVADVLDVPVRALTTARVLDEYRERPETERYYGLWASPTTGIWPGWPTGTGPKILGYLRAEHATFLPIINALRRLPVRAVIHVPDCSAEFEREWSNSSVRLCRESLNMQCGAQDCDVAVCYGSGGFVADLLAQGKPLLLAPPVMQQAMVAQRVLLAGAGVPGEPFWTEDQYLAALTELIENDHLVVRAEALAQTLGNSPRGADMEHAIVSACEAIL